MNTIPLVNVLARFQRLPKDGVRSPSCDCLFAACADIPSDMSALGAASKSNT